MNKPTILLGMVLFVAAAATAEPDGGIVIRLVPGIGMPVGTDAPTDGLDRYAALDVVYSLFQFPALTLSGGVGYGRIPINPAGGDVAGRLLGRAELGYIFSSSERLDLGMYVTAGAYRLFADDSQYDGRFGASVGGGLRLTQQVTPGLSLALELGYARQYGLYNVVTIGGGAQVRVLRPRPLLLEHGEVINLFPALYQHYATRPIGSVVLTNNGPTPLENIEVTLMADSYMDQPTLCGSVEHLAPDSSQAVELYGLFSSRILTLTEDAHTPLLLQARYTANNKEMVAEQTLDTLLYNRNAISWKDDRSAAAFVSPRNPVTLRFARRVVAAVAAPVQAVDPAIQNAVAIHAALGLADLRYVVDPESPYRDLSQAEGAIDFLQFPSQTFDYGAGDCDDLVILYCSLLEAVGIETAFITTPGHIHMAFALSETDGEMPIGGRVISREGRQWVPLETTLVGESFLRAWRAGSVLVEEHGDSAGFFPVRLAQELYPPAEYFATEQPTAQKLGEDIAGAFEREWREFINLQIHNKVEALQARTAQSTRPEVEWNRLGILYARYGLTEEARESFRTAAASGTSAAALYNLGNLAFAEGDWSEALAYYLEADRLRPDSSRALLQLSRVYRELGDLEQASNVMTRLEGVAPELALANQYILDDSSAGRAAAAARELVWAE